MSAHPARRLIALLSDGLLLGAGLLLEIPTARCDGGNAATSIDAWAKERVDEFEELGDKKPTLKNVKRRMEILTELERAPCRTSQRFLLGLLKKRSNPGDQRLYALRSLTKMADEKTLDGVLAVLGGSKDETLWEAFGDYLARDPSAHAATWRAGPGLASRSTEAVCACLASLAAQPVDAARERIGELYAQHAAKESEVEVAYAALRALLRAGGDGAEAVLLEAARHPDWRLRLVAAEALPGREPFEGEVLAAVRALLQDEAATVRQTVARATGTHQRKAVASHLIGLLADPRVRTRDVARRALEQISGRKLGYDPKAWAAWLAEQDPGTPESLTLPSYHGFEVASDRVVFLVDASSSMLWPWRKETHRIDVARTELATVLEQLTPDTLFNVIVFAEKPVAWKKKEMPASPGNTQSAARWAMKQMAEPEGDTYLYEALEAAYANNPEFDTIYLLTDGDPTAGRYWSQEGLVASVRAWTRFRRTAIHTIGLSLFLEDVGMPNLSEDRHAMQRLLEALAKETGGACRVIERVPPPK